MCMSLVLIIQIKTNFLLKFAECTGTTLVLLFVFKYSKYSNVMADHVFTKRSGTTDSGKDYEHYFISNLLLKLIINDDVEDFFLSADDNDYGSFDDVVVEIIYRSKHRQIYAIQLKHLDRNLTVAALESDKGKFSITTYFKNFNFRNDYTAAILYTNASLQAPNGRVLNLQNYEKTTIWKTSLTSVLTTTENGKYFYLGTENSTVFRNFCKHFSLYTNQANDTELEKQTRNLFKKLFDCKGPAFTEYIHFISNWCKIRGKKEKLNKNWIRNVIATRILTPFIQPLSFSSRKVDEKTKLLREAIALFQTTIFDSGCYEKVRELWSDFKEELKDIKKINQKYSITADFIETIDDLNGRDKETSIILWILDKCPLILGEAPEVYRAIKVFKEKKFIIFNPKTTSRNKSVFEKLSDLENHPTIYRNILSKFTCSLQGREEMTMENFFRGCEDVGKIITTNELLQMMDGSLIIGGRKEVLPACHRPGRIKKNVIKTECLKQLKKNDLIVITFFPKTRNFRKDGKFHITTIKEFLKSKCKTKNDVYLCEEKCFRADVEELFRKTQKANYYYFRYLDENFLECISSSDIGEMKKMIEKEHYSKESELYKNDNDINIICANPGMGKTTLMKSLKNNFPPSVWTLLIYPRNYSSYFRKKKTNINEFLTYYLNENEKNISIFDQNVIRFLIQQKRISILWDGLDEMEEENLEVVMNIIHDANSQGYTQWVTSRNHLKSTLENEFKTFSKSLEEFDKKQQKIYIGERLNLNKKEIDDIFTKIQRNIAMFPNNNILGIPLQSFMLTELFQQDKPKYLKLLNEIFSLTELYEHFVEKKFSVYFTEKQNLGDVNDVLQKQNKKVKKLMIDGYEIAAVYTYFDETIIRSLKIYSENIQEDPVGFVVKTTNDAKSEFCHNSFGEYFAALFLSKNCNNFFVTYHLLFERKYDNIRFFYDLILAKGCRAHIAVLYKNYELLKTCTENEISAVDKIGRSTFEVAKTWRKTFPVLEVTEKADGFQLDKYLSIENANEIINLQKVLSFLVSHSLSDKETSILFLNQHLLLPFISISRSDVERYNQMGHKYIVSILVYAVAVDFPNVLSFFENIPFIYDFWKFNLLNIALRCLSINCLKELLVHKPYKECLIEDISTSYIFFCILHDMFLFDIMVDVVKNIFNSTLSGLGQKEILHFACRDGNFGVAMFLIKFGVPVNSTDGIRRTPLHYACENGNFDLVKFLIENESEFTKKDCFGKVPLRYAVDANSEKVVRYLLEIGAPVDEIDYVRRETCLHHACCKGFFSIAKLLLEYKATPNVANKFEQSVVHLTSDLAVLNLLIENGANLNSRDKEGRMLIHYACSKPDKYSLNFMEIVIKNTSNVNILDKRGLSPLHLLCKTVNDPDIFKEVLNLLISKGAVLDIKDKNGRYPVHYAYLKSKEVLENLLEKGATFNVSDNFNQKPLHYTISKSNEYKFDIINFLLENTDDIDVSDKFGKTLLHNVCSNKLFSKYFENESIEIVKYLILYGTNIDLKDNYGKTPLHYACSLGKHCSLKLVDVLIENCSSLNVTDNHKKTPLHYACISRDYPISKLLIDKGCDINVVDEEGKTALHYAYQKRLFSVVDLFLESDAKIDSSDGEGKMLIHYACSVGRLKDVQFYLKRGVDINIVDKDNRSPLHHACKNNQYDTARALITSGAKTDIKDLNGQTPLHYSSLKGDLKVARLLIKSGAKINIADNLGRFPIHLACCKYSNTIAAPDLEAKTPLHYACQASNYNVVNFFVRKRETVTTQDRNDKVRDRIIYSFCCNGVKFDCGLTESESQIPLSPLSINENTVRRCGVELTKPERYETMGSECRNKIGHKVVEVLLEFGANMNVVDHAGRSPLHYACMVGSEKSVELFIKLGASVNETDKFNRTPIHYSSVYGHYDIIRILLQNNAALNISDIDKKLPIHYACLKIHQEILESGEENSYGFNLEEVSLYAACNGCRQEAKKKRKFNEHSYKHECHENSGYIVDLLLEHRSRVNYIDNNGKTPVDYAQKYRNWCIVEFLSYYTHTLVYRSQDKKHTLNKFAILSSEMK